MDWSSAIPTGRRSKSSGNPVPNNRPNQPRRRRNRRPKPQQKKNNHPILKAFGTGLLVLFILRLVIPLLIMLHALVVPLAVMLLVFIVCTILAGFIWTWFWKLITLPFKNNR
jgi:protein-S-isoprenylcysteine O-methyltransferase Ste14